MGVSTSVALRQCLQQRLSFLEIGRVKALGEPAIDRGQQLVRLRAFTLLLPEATEAHGGAQLQRLRFLAAGDVKGLLKTRLGVVRLSTPLGGVALGFA